VACGDEHGDKENFCGDGENPRKLGGMGEVHGDVVGIGAIYFMVSLSTMHLADHSSRALLQCVSMGGPSVDCRFAQW